MRQLLDHRLLVYVVTAAVKRVVLILQNSKTVLGRSIGWVADVIFLSEMDNVYYPQSSDGS